jgi:hypothetical protein
VTLEAGNIIINNSSNTLTMKLTLPTGRFQGSAQNPASGKTFPFSGVVLQKQNGGAGYFLGTNQGGAVLFGPAP